ncbi:protein phosphatase 2C domain-containing protein [Streptomyces sp. NPDC050287]|uniref:protein phosphatase 2C domain-containing protein n=1 Tax=Streptomyces sp. NPDC050287 TaxID=3365608 RepID=UPI00379AB859
MSQQGGKPTGPEDDWWGQLYDDSTEDTGPTSAPDSLDDRFASAARTVERRFPSGREAREPGELGEAPDVEGAIPAPRSGDQEGGSGGGPRSGAPEGGSGGGLRSGAPEGGSGGGPGSGVPEGGDAKPGSGAGEAAGPPPRPGVGERRGFPPGSDVAGSADTVDGPYRTGSAPWPAPWEPSSDLAQGPAAFPPGPKPPGFAERDPQDAPPQMTGGPSSAQTRASRTPRDALPPPPPPFAPPPPATPPADRTSTGPAPTDGRDTDTDTDTDPDTGTAPAPDATPPTAATSTAVGALRGEPRTPTTPSLGATTDPVQDQLPTPGPAPAAQGTRVELPLLPPEPAGYVGSGPPTYEAEPTALPTADPDGLDELVADTVLDGARYGACTLRAASVRGDSARFRGEPRRDSLLTARFGTGDHALVLVAMATGARATSRAHRAAAEACHWIGRAVGRSHARLAEDIRAGRRGDLKSGLHRLTDRSLGKLRAGAAEQGIDPEEYAATLRCLLLPADPECRTRVFFGVGAGGLFRLRDGEWQDIEPRVQDVTGAPVVGFGSLPSETPEGDRLTMDLGIPTPPSPYEPAPEPPRDPFRFRASIARPGDTLLMCSGGLADPLRGEPELCRYLTGRWSGPTPPGLAAFLADTQVRVKGYADDRTAAAVWEA